MKSGYYLSELGNLQIWYPMGHFKRGMQTMEAYGVKSSHFIRVHYTPKGIEMLLAVLEFEYLGEL